MGLGLTLSRASYVPGWMPGRKRGAWHAVASKSADSDQLKPSGVRGTDKRVPGKDTEASIMGV